MKNFARPFSFLVLALLASAAGNALADWGTNGWQTVLDPVSDRAVIKSSTDGAGGMLLIMKDPDQAIFRVSVSRIDHTGNKLWGAGGKVIPVDATADSIAGPIDIVDDGALGAFCIYSRFYGASQILYLAHLSTTGTVTMSVPIGDFGPDPVPVARLVKSDNGDLLISWNRSVGTMDRELITTRRAPDGALVWQTTVWADNNNSLDRMDWVADSDGFGGLVFGINYQSFSGYWEGRVQRLTNAGVVMWGSHGDEVFGHLGKIVAVLPDNAGGAYVASSLGWGNSWAQHVDALGNNTWPAGGVQVFNLNDWPDPSTPVFCVDGGGGFFTVDGITDLFAQHVDINGSLLWGSPGLQITTLDGWQYVPGLTYDGFGGFVVTYEDLFYSEPPVQARPRAISAIRVDGFGNTVWEHTGFWWNMVDGGQDDVVTDPQVVADGSGGAQVYWKLYEGATWTVESILAAGLGSDGASPPVPVLTYINPDAGSIGDAQQALVLGDYLDPSLTYSLTRSGAADLVLTNVAAVNGQLVSGDLDLTDAQPGAYDLTVSGNGSEQARLANAYGVGEMVPCDQDEPMAALVSPQPPFGSQRRMATDSQGRTISTWADFHDGLFNLVSDVLAPDGTENLSNIASSANQILAPTVAIGPDDVVYYVYVENDGGADYLRCHLEDPANGPVDYILDIRNGVGNPVVVVDFVGQAQIVYEVYIGGQIELFQVTASPAGTGSPIPLNAGSRASFPDLTRDGDGLMLTFVRDFWWPGLREVCYQHGDGANWDAPVGIYFGVHITSASVAWDGVGQLLFSWVLDNSTTGPAPLLHTMLMKNHTAGAVRWRVGLPLIDRCSVASNGPGNFQLLTLESDGNLPLQVYLRAGNGEVFYPRRRLNSNSNVDFSYFCTRYGYDGVTVMWNDYTNPAQPLYRFVCSRAGGISAAPPPIAAVSAGAYPNPFNPSTTVRYGQHAEGWTRLAIYDVAGRRVRTLVDGFQRAGNHTIAWDGRDTSGRGLPSGVYFGRLQLPGGQAPAVIKLMMLK